MFEAFDFGKDVLSKYIDFDVNPNFSFLEQEWSFKEGWSENRPTTCAIHHLLCRCGRSLAARKLPRYSNLKPYSVHNLLTHAEIIFTDQLQNSRFCI